MALDFAAIITRPNVVHKQQVKHNTFKLYIRNESLEIKIIRSLNYFLLLKLNVGSELSYNVADRSRRRRRQTRPWQVDLYRRRQRRSRASTGTDGEVGRRHDFERRGKWPGKLRI